MADEVFEIGISVSGEGSGAKAFENLKLREMETKEEAKKLAAALDDLKRSGTATDQQLEEAARALIRAKQAASQYATEARRVQAAQQQASRATVASTQATAANSMQAMAFATRLGQVSASLSAVGGIIGKTNPELASFGQHLSQVGASAAAGGAAFGPWGAVIGGAVGALTQLVLAQQAAEEAADAAAEAIRRQTTDIELLQRRMENQDQVERLADGLATVTEQTRAFEEAESRLRAEQERHRLASVALADANERLRDIEGRLGGAMHAGAEDLRRLGLEYDAIQAQVRGAAADVRGFTVALETQQGVATSLAVGLALAQEREAATAAASEAAAARRPRGGGGGGGRAAAARREAERDAEREEERLREQSMRAKEAANAVVLNEEEAARQINATRAAMARFGVDQNNAYIESQLDGMDRVARRERELAEARQQQAEQAAEEATRQQRELGQITGDMWNSIGGTVTDAAGEMAKFVISGAEGGSDAFLAMLDSFLEATAIQYTIKAIAEVAEAVASFARQDYASGGQHLAAAALAGGVAAATGLASAAIPNAPSGAGAGGGLQPAAPQSGGGGTNFNVSIYAPNAILTERERASMITESLRVARREGGSGDIRL